MHIGIKLIWFSAWSLGIVTPHNPLKCSANPSVYCYLHLLSRAKAKTQHSKIMLFMICLNFQALIPRYTVCRVGKTCFFDKGKSCYTSTQRGQSQLSNLIWSLKLPVTGVYDSHILYCIFRKIQNYPLNTLLAKELPILWRAETN